MNHDEATRHALSFGGVADAYDRARPSYPREAAIWLTGAPPLRVLELGAGTGKLTEQLAALGHVTAAIDPLPEMLAHLARRLPQVGAVLATAERIPVRSRSVDVVVSGQAFHWFDPALALPEIARVLRPGGRIALTWNLRDERIPWVRRLGELIGTQDHHSDPRAALADSALFDVVETEAFRHWQRLDRDGLRDLVASRSNIAVLDDVGRERVLRRVEALYDEYGRGADGMLLPYLTHCFRATVRPDPPGRRDDPPHNDDSDSLLIDFN
ncbi:MAG: class I SAM-dependent methyltransferase [Nocardioidaceae bacterium]